MRVPRSRVRWSDDEAGCFATPSDSDTERGDFRLGAGTGARGEGAPLLARCLPADADEALWRLSASAERLDAARRAVASGHLESFVQSVQLLLAGTARLDVRVTAVRGVYQGVYSLLAMYQWAGEVASDRETARLSALRYAASALQDAVAASRRRPSMHNMNTVIEGSGGET